jgi:hypothetical protein
MLRAASWAFVVLAASAATSRGEYVVTFAQVGTDVVATGTGTLDLTTLLGEPSPSFTPDVIAALGVVAIGPQPNSFVGYPGISGPTSIGPGPAVTHDADSSTGDRVTVDGHHAMLQVFAGYVSGATLFGTDTWDNTTIGGLGLAAGTYTWTWGTGTPHADSFVVIVPDVTAAPAPGGAVLAGTALGLVGFAAGIRRRLPVVAA